MTLLKRSVSVIVVSFVLAIVIGFFLPSRAHVERSIIVDAPPEAVFPLVNNLREFNKWSPWSEKDPAADYVFDGPDSGVGARLTWASNKPDVGSGSQEIIASDPHKLVRTQLDFGAQGVATAHFILIPQDGNKTQVTWGFDADFGWDLLGRYFGLWFDYWIGPDYEHGLEKLKQAAESSTQQTQ